MSDIYSKEKRSQIMSLISGRETKPEITVRKFLHANGFRYRKNDIRYPGKPDILLPKYKSIVLVHGCFWHGHNCKAGALPTSNFDFWESKIHSNILRDNKNRKELNDLGWNVITIWECQLKNKEIRDRTLAELIKSINENK